MRTGCGPKAILVFSSLLCLGGAAYFWFVAPFPRLADTLSVAGILVATGILMLVLIRWLPSLVGGKLRGQGGFAGVQGTPGGYPVVPVGGPHAAEHVQVTATANAADIVRDGVHTTATVISAQDTGMTTGMVHQEHAGTPTGDDPLVVIELQVTGSDGRMFTARALHRVPPEHRHRIVTGALLRVAYLPGDPGNTTAIQWDRV